jgi:hypothetical protein
MMGSTPCDQEENTYPKNILEPDNAQKDERKRKQDRPRHRRDRVAEIRGVVIRKVARKQLGRRGNHCVVSITAPAEPAGICHLIKDGGRYCECYKCDHRQNVCGPL